MKKLLLLMALGLSSTVANAYTVFTMNGKFNPKAKNDLYIIGYGEELGTQFLSTAVAKARMQMEAYPDRGQVFVWAKEKNEKWDADTVRRISGTTIISTSDKELKGNDIYSAISDVKRISSLHFVGHSASDVGFGMQKGARFNFSKLRMATLKKNFTDDSYIILHGCNTGFLIAPELSAMLDLPVLGSMTSTDFQQLHNDGTWYWNNKGQFPAGGWARTNTLSYAQDIGCTSGQACHRLKPNNHPYVGYWGKYETGLSYYKAFCNFDLSKSKNKARCDKGLAQSIRTWPSIVNLTKNKNAVDFKLALKDFLCPKFATNDRDKTCFEVLDHYDRTGQVLDKRFFYGTQTPCTLAKCQFTTTKVSVPDAGKVDVFSSRDAGNRSIVQEYQLYLDLYNRFGL